MLDLIQISEKNVRNCSPFLNISKKIYFVLFHLKLNGYLYAR